MRLLLTGIDSNGRSYLVSSDEVTPAEVPGMSDVRSITLFSTTECPPAPRPPSDAHNIDTRLPAGILRWSVVEHAPRPAGGDEASTASLHTSDAVDLMYVLEGDVDIILEDGSHRATAGDCVVMAGISHGIQAGPNGSKSLVSKLGMTPLA